MLKLDKLTLSGFKSFGDHAEVVFPEGITAVVGPNGCGKSNIGDAINWVLGEQSARMLRGSSMQDVIFNGSEARKPVGMAEVNLHLSAPSEDRDEPRRVTITRRLFRSGESEYLMDGQKTRLRDIQDMLREERVGAQTYAFTGGRLRFMFTDPSTGDTYQSTLVLTPNHIERPVWIENARTRHLQPQPDPDDELQDFPEIPRLAS